MKYVYGANDESFSYSEEYEKAEDGFKDAVAELDLEIDESLFYGEAKEYIPNICGDSLIDDLQEEAYSECGEWSDGFLSLSKEKRKSFDEHMNKALIDWLKANDEMPTFYTVANVKDRTVTKEMIES